MPSRTSKIPAYRLHKSSGQAVVTLSGRDFYLGRYGTPEIRSEYDRIVAEWVANGRRWDAGGANESMTLVELMAAYWEHASTYYVKYGRPTGEQDCIRSALRRLKALYGHTRVADFGPLALKAVRQRMIDEDLCRGFINRSVSRIKTMFRWACENELIEPTTFHALQSVSGLKKHRSAARETEPVKPAPDAHVKAIRPFVSRQVWAMIELQRLTGMRPGEVTTMRACGVSIQDTVSPALDRPSGASTFQMAGRYRYPVDAPLGPQ